MAVDISTLSPDTLERLLALEALARDNGMTLVVTSARRSCAEQNAIYAEGRTKPGPVRTNARGCSSWHVVGRAFDVEIVQGEKNWPLLGGLGKSLGLEWGGDWTGSSGALQDYGHFQYRPGLALSDVCPDPDNCHDNVNIDVPGGAAPPSAGPWMVCTCTGPGKERHVNGPRFRLLSNGQIEIENEGTPVKTLPAWVLKYSDLVRIASVEFDMPEHVIDAFMAVEGSRGDPMATSGAAFGLMQLTLPTAKDLNGGVSLTPQELGDPLLNIRLGTKLLRKLWDRTKGNIVEMAFSYNAGGVYCGPGHFQGEPCYPANRWNAVADCHGAPGKKFTYDYGSDVIAYANSALFLVPDGPPLSQNPPAPPSPLPPSPFLSKTNQNSASPGVFPWIVGGIAAAMIAYPFLTGAAHVEKSPARPRQR
jgi:peptidoglycan L-alanyl-D-glutamate endopeptidase CwlK